MRAGRPVRHRRVIAIPVAVSIVAACGETATTDDDPEDVLDQAVQELAAMPGGPPAAIVVVQRGSDRSVHATGVAEVGADAEPDVEDHMRIASVSKAFNGATALSLVDEDVLSRDDTIAERLPDLPTAWGEVTLRQMLSHTSGLPDFTESEPFQEALVASPEEPPTPSELVTYVADEPLVFPPGTQYRYSNTDNVSTPADLTDFVRGYVGGELFGEEVRDEQQALFIPGGTSDPIGPGDNSATMALFRYHTECGTVYGHTGNIFGYTQLIAASPDGQRSVTASISLQRAQRNEGQAASVFAALQRLRQAAICFALD